MKVSNPLISIIIACHNSEKTIGNTLASIIKSLIITELKFEIIAVMDHCTDETEKIVRKFKKTENIKLIFPRDRGRSSARNAGAAAAKGSYFVFIDSDCLLNRFFFKELAKDLDLYPFAWIQPSIVRKPLIQRDAYFDFEKKTYLKNTRGTNNLFERDRDPVGDTAACCIRREIFYQCNGFNVKLPRFEDRDLSYRMFLRQVVFKANNRMKVTKIIPPKSELQYLHQILEESIGYLRSAVPALTYGEMQDSIIPDCIFQFELNLQNYIRNLKFLTGSKKNAVPKGYLVNSAGVYKAHKKKQGHLTSVQKVNIKRY